MFGDRQHLAHGCLRTFKYIVTALLTVLKLLALESIPCPSPALPLCIADGLIPQQPVFPRLS